MVESAYIHIPFCKSKCGYCSFVSFCNTEKKSKYLDCLKKEILSDYDNEVLKTLYIGGGTPSILSVEEIGSLANLFLKSSNCEVTVELNPEDVDYEYLVCLSQFGINRLSFGCQTFNDDILKLINRRHSSDKVFQVINTAKEAGYDNLSLDFIYGLPNQTKSMFLLDLQKAINLGLPHISLYGLKLEEGSYFFEHTPENLPDEDTQADMYLAAVDYLIQNGYIQYEVSNFAQKGFQSRHNLTYWNNKEYYGFGVAAHGYKGSVRYENTTCLEKYFENPITSKTYHKLSQQAMLEEEIFLGFRLLEGIDISLINTKFNIDFDEIYRDILVKYLGLNLIEKTKKGYKLTINGILVSNVILADFLLS